METAKCENCKKEIDVTGLPRGLFWCKDCNIPDSDNWISDPKEIAEAIDNDPLLNGKILRKSPFEIDPSN